MKKFLGILVLGLLWCNISFAEMKRFGDHIFGELNLDSEGSSYWIDRFCIDGYVFLVASSFSSNYRNTNSRAISSSMTQFYEVVDGKSLPRKCK